MSRRKKIVLIAGGGFFLVILLGMAMLIPAERSSEPPFAFIKEKPVFNDFVVEGGQRQEAWTYTFPSEGGYRPIAETYKKELVGKGFTPMWVTDKLILKTPGYDLVSVSKGRSPASMENADGSEGWVTVRVSLERPANLLDHVTSWFKRFKASI